MLAGVLAYAYWMVTGRLTGSYGVALSDTMEVLVKPIIMGVIATILIFWSLSGFILRVVQSAKKVYLKDTNMFVLRQLNNKINTTVMSMSVICLMLFMTISILSVSLSLRSTLQKELKEMTPVDVNLEQTANLPESYTRRDGTDEIYTKEQREESRTSISSTLIKNGFDMNKLKDVIELNTYCEKELTFGKFFANHLDSIKTRFPMVKYETTEDIVKISDYNKIARLYGISEYELKSDEYMVICDFDSFKVLRDEVLGDGNNILKIGGKEYKQKYNECKNGYIYISTSHTNTGIILVPDDCNLTEDMKEKHLLIANYNAKNDKEKEEIEAMFSSSDSGLIQKLAESGIVIDGMTKIAIIESSVGLAAIITFIAIYLGIIFLIASSAILALKQLTESSDNKQRYTILRKIGCDEKMINRALFRQIGIFFLLPLSLAIIHSIFGIQFAMIMMEGLASAEELLPSIIGAVIVIVLVYGAYFIATYMGSKNVIREE